MVRIQLDIPENEREQFAKQAELEGMALDAWLIAAARQRVKTPRPDKEARFESLEELQAFWKWCDAQNDLDREPDWEEHLRNIDESIRERLPDV